MNTEKVKDLFLSLVDERGAEEGTAVMDMELAIGLCQIALRYCWLKANYDLAAKDVVYGRAGDALARRAHPCGRTNPMTDVGLWHTSCSREGHETHKT
jgi:hypothetical protein